MIREPFPIEEMKKILRKCSKERVMISEHYLKYINLGKRDIILLKQEVNYFLKNSISKKVIPLEKIDLILVKRIFDKIKNEADSNIFSSAIQENKENRLIIITNDANDCKKENFIEAIKDTKYKEIPEIKYIF